MRIESVTAHAFGPFLDAVLNLAPGLNLLYGPNESGKSNWHAAIYAALCGMRRGRGAMRSEDQKFKERHQLVEAISAGRQPAELSTETLLNRIDLPTQWPAQLTALGLS